MALPDICTRIFEAVDNDSTSQLFTLSQIYDQSEFVQYLGKCNDQFETPIKVAVKKRHFNIALVILEQLQQTYSAESYRLLCLDVISQVLSEKVSFVEKLECLIDFYVIGLSGKFFQNTTWLELVLHSIISSPISRLEKIVAFELVGAAFICGKLDWGPNKNDLSLGIQCWETALTLRSSSVKSGPAFPKISSISSDVFQNAFGGVAEFTTLEELTHLEKQELNSLYSDIQVQALLLIQRNLSQFHPRQKHFCYFHFNFLLDYVWHCYNKCEFSRAISFSLVIMDQLTAGCNSPTYIFKCMDIFDNRLRFFPTCFKKMRKLPVGSPGREKLTRANLLVAIKQEAIMARILRPIAYDDQTKHFNVMKRIYELVSMLFELFPQQQLDDVNESISEIVLLNPWPCLPDLLRLAREKFEFSRPSDVIHLFLKAGVDPNGIDWKGETSLLIWINSWNIIYNDLMFWDSYTRDYTEMYWSVFQAIVDAGGRLDKTVLKQLEANRNSGLEYDPHFNLFLNAARPLSLCELCAQVIRHRDIPIQDRLPEKLRLFIRSRRSKGHSSPYPPKFC